MNRFQFKLFLATFMMLDHIDFLVSEEMGIWLHILTRFVAVGFAYLAVEGFFYTKDITKYLMRLYIAAGLMFLGNNLINFMLHKPQESLTNLILLNPDFCFVTIIPLLFLYNGQQGLKNKFSQYFFYVFYPAHLWILAIMHYLLIKA